MKKNRNQILTIALIAATAAALYLCYLIARPFLASLVWALALAVLAFPFYKRIENFVNNKNLASGLATFFVAVIIVVPVVLVTRQVAREAWHNAEHVRQSIETGEWRTQIEKNRFAAEILHTVEAELNIRETLARAAEQVPGIVSGFVSESAWIVFQLLITFFALFFFFRDSDRFVSGVRWVLPLSDSETDAVFRRVIDTLYATVFGEMLLATMLGTLGGLMFWLLGLPVPFLWGFVMAILAFLPMVGTWLVWFPASVILMIQGEWVRAFILIGWGILVLSMLSAFLYPVLVGNRMHLDTLLVLIAIFGGIMAFGMVGVIFGPLVLAVTIALIEIWKARLGTDEPTAAETIAESS